LIEEKYDRYNSMSWWVGHLRLFEQRQFCFMLHANDTHSERNLSTEKPTLYTYRIYCSTKQ